MQDKKQSMIEAISGTLIGLVFSFMIQIIIYPSLGIPVSIGQNILITSVFFVASIVRGYLVRRLFNKIFKK
jgi:high-affinity Fe2+/Pb2+ permease|tara:strand:- start:115 stop:327 length:213 start_codon:yes stop_codon:yes gene_type:complete